VPVDDGRERLDHKQRSDLFYQVPLIRTGGPIGAIQGT
jgi:hypothetical protein